MVCCPAATSLLRHRLAGLLGKPNVPVLLNGYETTRSRRDGLAAIAVEVAGTPQSIEIDDSNLPLSAIAGHTHRIVTIRAGGGSVANFDIESSESGAIVLLRVNGNLPSAGTEVITNDGLIRWAHGVVPGCRRSNAMRYLSLNCRTDNDAALRRSSTERAVPRGSSGPWTAGFHNEHDAKVRRARTTCG